MTSFGLDPSLTGFGWCLHCPNVVGSGRVLSKGVWKTPSSDVFVSRYMFMRDSLIELLSKYPDVLHIGVESPPFGEMWSEGLYGLFLYVIEAVYCCKRDVVFFDPMSVKLLARMDASVRKGTMSKSDMVEAAKVDTGIRKWNHNEADAYIIARSASRFWEFQKGVLDEGSLTPSERHVFSRTAVKKGKLKKLGLVYRESDRFFKFSSF